MYILNIMTLQYFFCQRMRCYIAIRNFVTVLRLGYSLNFSSYINNLCVQQALKLNFWSPQNAFNDHPLLPTIQTQFWNLRSKYDLRCTWAWVGFSRSINITSHLTFSPTGSDSRLRDMVLWEIKIFMHYPNVWECF